MIDKLALEKELSFDDSTVFYTIGGTPYLKHPVVELVTSSKPLEMRGIAAFLNGFAEELGFDNYFSDSQGILAASESIGKFAGQLCYYSFGVGSTKNVDAGKYFQNIKRSGHWSILEHTNFGFLIYGIDRACTHEIVRHRKLHPSQVSQRYCDGKTLRFVERVEYQQDAVLHQLFEERVDRAVKEYTAIGNILSQKQDTGYIPLFGDSRRAKRKKVNQSARSLLPNETEAPIFLTGNVRDWRDFINKRATEGADLEIRQVAIKVLLCLYREAPLLFDDYVVSKLEDDTYVASSEFVDRG